MNKLKPTQDRILVKTTEDDTSMHGDLIVVDTQQRQYEAEVIEVSDGVFNDSLGKIKPLGIRVGMNVLIGREAGVKIQVGDVEHRLLAEQEVLGIIS